MAKERIIDELHDRLAEQGFTDLRPGHGCIFRFIEPGGSRLTYLADRSNLTKQAVGEFADDLQRLGYVERIPDPADGRAKLIQLTDRGHAGQAEARRIFADIERRLAREIGAERMALLRETLEILAGVASEEAAAA